MIQLGMPNKQLYRLKIVAFGQGVAGKRPSPAMTTAVPYPSMPVRQINAPLAASFGDGRPQTDFWPYRTRHGKQNVLHFDLSYF